MFDVRNKIPGKKTRDCVFIFLLFFLSPCAFAVGLDLNVCGQAGTTLGAGGAQVGQHDYFWNSPESAVKAFSGGGSVSTDIVLTPSLAVEAGIGFLHSGRAFTAADGGSYGNGIVCVQYNRLEIPLGLQYRYTLHKISSEPKILFTGGVAVSFFIGAQVYKDNLTTASSNFLSPSFSQQVFLSVRYLFKLGSGSMTVGIRGNVDIQPLSYTIASRAVDMGRSLPVVLELGYSFPIIVNSAIEKENVKKKRVDVYERDD